MSVLRAFCMRVDLPRKPERVEKDAADLSTFLRRGTNDLSVDALHIAPSKELWTPLSGPVPGRLIAGTFGEDQRARFLLRLPKEWNGRLVVAAASGITDETTYDVYFSDFLLSKGYAFAATDKGVRRAMLDGDTVLMPQGEDSSIRRWPSRLEELVGLCRREAVKFYGRKAERIYAVGLSNGGWLARKLAELPEAGIDGAVEVSGVLWRAEKGNALRELPRALRAEGGEGLERAGFFRSDKKWDPVVAFYRAAYWDAVTAMFVNDLDPDYRGELRDYDLDKRPRALEAIASFENTGSLQAPLISIAGRKDLLIPCKGHAEGYRELVASKGKSGLHELRIVEDASHIDTNSAMFPFVQPLMPHAHRAFDDLVARVEGAATAPSSRRRS